MMSIHGNNYGLDGRQLHDKCLTSALASVLALLAVFIAGMGDVRADGLFDFQMKLANKGNVEAQFKVGEMYEKGFGVGKNEEESLKWITKAAEQGHETAQFKLLYYDIRKNGINAGNKARYDELNSKAKSGNGQAQYYLGLMYGHGVGVKQNDDTALDWLSKASLVGVTAAEAEITGIRERQQRLHAQQRSAAEKRKAQEEAQRREEERKRLEAKRQAEEAERQREAEARARAEKTAAMSAEQREREAAEERARQLAQREAEEREKEKKRQALLESRKQKEEEKKAMFESDPCSGKSARFLSTCR